MEISEKRKQSVEKARQAWIRKLIDLSRRNNLLYYRSLKWGTLSLSLENSERWVALLRGEAVSLRSLVANGPDEDLILKALAIWRKAQENQEEKGLATMFVGLGMATWKPSDEGRASESPILLLPVTLDIKGHAGTSLAIRCAGAVQINLVLLHVLETEFGVAISQDEVRSRLEANGEEDTFDPSPVYQLFKESCGSVPEFAINGVAVLGNFAFQKMAMVRDLQDNAEQLISSDLIAALAGDTEAKQAIGTNQQNPDPRELDKVPPQLEFLILDADSSQQSAIAAVLTGQNAVIHGPPGTGKSQTIANLVASLAAAGKRVLFVAEKRAALQVVLKRLQQVGLEKIAIDLHGADVSPRRVMEQVAAALSAVRQALPVDCEGMHQRYVERRDRLNRHVESLHRKRSPGNLSVFELQGRLLRLPAKDSLETRWRGPELAKIGSAKIRDLLREAAGLGPLFLRCDPSPWNGVRIEDGATAEHAVDLVARLNSQTWPMFMESTTEVMKAVGFRMPRTLKEAQQTHSLLEAVARTLESYSPEIFKQDIQVIIGALARAKRGRMRAAWTWCTSAKYRRARGRALSYRTGGKARSTELFAELSAAEDQRLKWADLSGHSSLPQAVPEQSGARRNLELALADLAMLASLVGKKQLDAVPLAELTVYIENFAKDRLTPMRLPKLYGIEGGLESSGAAKLVAELRRKTPRPEQWIPGFDHCWYSSCLEAAQVKDPEVAGFNGRTHDGFVEEFKELDKERVRVAAARVQRAYAERAIKAMNEHRNEEFIIRSEAEKKRRHRSLRALFAEARHVLTAVCPCWMASPLSVSQLLDTTPCFDFVIFDEASQVLPEDSIPAIMRGAYVVIAGDRWQLPPTTFFAAAEEDELADDESNLDIQGYESLLDTTNAFMPSWYLDWHYRSRDESLISFSNHHIYQNRLVTFPGPGGSPVIQHFLVEQALGIDGQEESCGAEVQKVVELVLDHAQKRPSESLGVIAMGIRHSDRVQRALDQALANRPELGPYFDPSNEERFFIKNLERVQGDERDAIILTIGYGKDRAGNLPFRFGPLLSGGGQRRLNVAVTRARRRMALVSSFSHLDMDMRKVKPGTGVELLRNYLEYAASGGKRLGADASTSFPMNSFEAEVFDVLSSKGVPLLSQVGASSYRIDLVAQHPHEPGRCVLAIECDGASYHSGPTARDRDRLRQQQLENLSWKFHRIWSTDWFMRKDSEVARAVAAYENAVAAANSENPVKGSQESSSPANMLRDTNRARQPRPNVPRRETITEYSYKELIEMISWIASDGRLRTDEEIIDELLPELGFQRRGTRIDGVLKATLEAYRQAVP